MDRVERELGEEERLRLSAHPLLHDLDNALRDDLISRFRIEDVEADVHLLEEGQPNSCLFVVLRGGVSVKLPQDSRRVSEVKLATLGPGEIFGEYSLFDGQPVSAAVYAAKASRLALLDKAELDSVLKAHPDGGHVFYECAIRILVTRLREKNSELDVVTIG